MGIKISRDPNRLAYRDRALSRSDDDDEGALELLTQTLSAKQAAAHQKKVFELTHRPG
jgi:hypothetical protein